MIDFKANGHWRSLSPKLPIDLEHLQIIVECAYKRGYEAKEAELKELLVKIKP